MPPQFSLIISTLNRTWQLKRLFTHLQDQDFRDFECIIIDQNDDNRLLPILEEYKGYFPIIHLHSAPGVSLGRNTGIIAAQGDFIAFPDDDCWYGKGLFNKVLDIFQGQPHIDIISGRTIDAEGRTSLGKFDRVPGPITKRNAFKRGNTNTYFLRGEAARKLKFDESIGPGAGTKWGCGEDTDFLLQAMAAGFILHYDPNLTVHHDEPLKEYNEAAIRRGYNYGLGMGRILKKNNYPLDFVLAKLLNQIGGMVVALVTFNLPRFKYHREVFKGRLSGWLAKSD